MCRCRQAAMLEPLTALTALAMSGCTAADLPRLLSCQSQLSRLQSLTVRSATMQVTRHGSFYGILVVIWVAAAHHSWGLALTHRGFDNLLLRRRCYCPPGRSCSGSQGWTY